MWSDDAGNSTWSPLSLGSWEEALVEMEPFNLGERCGVPDGRCVWSTEGEKTAKVEGGEEIMSGHGIFSRMC